MQEIQSSHWAADKLVEAVSAKLEHYSVQEQQIGCMRSMTILGALREVLHNTKGRNARKEVDNGRELRRNRRMHSAIMYWIE